MHPVITQAIAAERAQDLRAQASAAGYARQLRHLGRGGRAWRFTRLPRAGRGPALRPAARRLRGPRAA